MKKAIVSFLLFPIALLWAGADVIFAREDGGARIAKDYKQTRDIINSILSEDKAANGDEEKDPGAIAAPPPGEMKEKPAGEGEKKALPDSSARGAGMAPAKEETAPGVTGEEEGLLKTGIDFYNNGLYDPALKNFQELAAKYPQGTFRETARFWMGKIHMKVYRYDDAIREFSAVTPESGDYPASIYHIAESYQMKGDRMASIENFQRVSARFPDHELADRALLGAGKLYLAGQNGAQALDSAVKLIRYYKDRDTLDDAYYLIGKVYEGDPLLKDVETARKVYRRFLEKGKSDRRFGASPLRKRVEDDLRRIERIYFRTER